MAKKKSLKTALVMAILSMVACLAMFVGTTFAWFTDSVTSSGNIIASGKLDVTMEYKNKLSDADWKDASKGAIFDYQNWEPGYTEVKYVKIENEGTLDFKYKINIYPNIIPTEGEVNLSDVIDVYVIDVADDATQSVTKADLVAANSKGTMTTVMKSDEAIYEGTLENDKKNLIAIVLKMKTSAGNEYMNLSAGDGFTVQLLATQRASEEDSFDNSYDNGAEYNPLEAYPIAKVEKIPTKDASGNDIVYSVANGDIIHSGDWNGLMLEDNISLDTAYKFTAVDVDDDVKYTKYGKWDADFEVSVDRLVEVGTLGLAGNYGGYGWIGFLSPVNLAANEPIRLLESAGFDVTYEDVVETVKEFSCGAWIKGSALAGSTITVALKLYDPESTDVIVAGKYSYTFPVIDDAPVAELKTYTDAEVAAIQNSLSTEGMSLSGFNGTPTFATDDVEIVSLYSFRPAETDEEVENSPYKDWNAEFVVVFNNEVPTGSIGLMGSYADIPWVYFALPDVSDSCDGVAANEPVLLMNTAAQIAGFTGFAWTYQDICAGMDSFECGVFVNADSTNTYADLPAGTTITVELRLYNPAVADGSDYITIQSVTQNLN